MMCASLIKSGASTLLLEKMEKPLRKVRITGKGRCNLTNNCSNEAFLAKVRSGVEFMQYSLDSFSTADCITYFEKIGVPLTVERGGRVFPTSMKALDIANKLEAAVRKNRVTIECNSEVSEIVKKGEKFVITYKNRGKTIDIIADKVVIATGGISYPATGSTGDGYRFAYKLGHSIESVRPSLTPLKIECRQLKELNRLLLKNISLRLMVSDSEVASEFGELEFFDYGIGGAIVLRISRIAVDALIDRKKVEICVDIKPALSEAKLLGRFTRECEANRGLNVESLLRKLMPSNLLKVVLERLKVKGGVKVATLGENERKDIIKVIKNLTFNVTGYGGFERAIVTAGGIELSELDNTTMESKIEKGLYIVGELLDIDADTGGYNLQLAFSTAFLAAQNL